MTLLVLDLSADQPGETTATAALRAAWPHLLLYFDSMLILGALWFGNRNAFEFVRRTDHPHTWLSLGELAFVALVPWTTTLVALHVHAPVAVAAYTGNLAVITWLDAATWMYATGRSGLATGMTPRLTRVSRGLACVPAAGFTVAAGAAWLSTWAGLVIAVTLPLIPLTGMSYRLQYYLSRPPTRETGREPGRG
jgi:uncharacterized membrane protein